MADDGKVKTVTDLLGEIKDLGNGDFIYRGQADSGWYLKSGAARRLSGNGKSYPKNEEMSAYINELIGNARSLGLEFHGGGGAECSDLKILAELQHYGAATNLLDFSKNILIALWMACSEEPGKDGEIFVFDLLNDEVDPLKIDDLPKAEERVIDQLLNGDNIWVWTPDNFVSRIQSQYSVFVIAPDESKITTQKIIIEAKAKKKLLIELETHFGISEIQVYPDLAGFARANRSTMPPVTRDANYYIQWGKKYINRKNFETAKDYLGKAISIDKKNSAAYFCKGRLYGKWNKPKEAVAAYDKAIELKPNYANAYNNRGVLKSDMGDKEAALDDYDKAIKFKPNYAIAYNNRGLRKSDMGDEEAALADYDEAIKLKPDYANAYNNRGNLKRNMGDKKAALDDYDTAIGLKPDFADAYYNRGVLKKNAGDLPGALADYNKALELDPDFADAYYNRGILKNDMGDKRAAIVDYNKAIELKPDFIEGYKNRAELKEQMGDKAGAEADLAKAAELEKQQKKGEK